MDHVHSLVAWSVALWKEYTYLSQDSALAVQLLLIGLGGMAILILWMRWQQWHNVPLWVPAIGSMIWVGIFFGTIHLQASFYGEADERCHEYQNGELAFELIQPPAIISPTAFSLEEEPVLLLIVRAAERWGDNFHVCAVSFSLPVAEKLINAFSQSADAAGGGNSFGTLSFTFGNGREAPNVTWEEFVPPPEKGPPEDPGDNI